MNILANNAVRFRRGPRDITGNLRVVVRHLLGAEAERSGVGIARLLREAGPVNGASIKARRRAGLEAAAAQAEFLQRLSQQNRVRLARTSGRILLLAAMNQSIEKSSGGDNHSLRGHGAPVAVLDAPHDSVLRRWSLAVG